MTPQELREKRIDILRDYHLENINMTVTLDQLEELDKEAATKPADQFYNLVNEIDDTRKLLNAAQGNPTRIVMVLDMITAVCVRYAQLLEKGEMKS